MKISGISNVESISAGLTHNVAVTSDGTVWAWGRSNYGQVGNGSTASVTTPEAISLTGIEQIVTYGDFTSALKDDGTL